MISSRKSPEAAPAPTAPGGALPFAQLVDEGELLGLLPVLQHPALVQPVRGDPVLRGLVHGVGADLDLDDLPVVAHDRGVQALVAVGLRHGDVVLEPALDGHPELVHEPQQLVALAGGVAEHAQAQQVVDLLQRLAAPPHLLVDRVEVLGPGLDDDGGCRARASPPVLIASRTRSR